MHCVRYLFILILLVVGSSVTSKYTWSEEVVGREIPKAFKEIVKIDKQGVTPQDLKLTHKDSSVFFFNSQDSDVVSLEVEFGGNHMHCHSPNLKKTSHGTLKTVHPISPRDFVIACFPDAGRYEFSATLGAEPAKSFKGVIEVE